MIFVEWRGPDYIIWWCINFLSIIKCWCHFSKIDVRNKWFKIWYFSSNLVAFATTKTKSKKKKKKLFTCNKEYKN